MVNRLFIFSLFVLMFVPGVYAASVNTDGTRDTTNEESETLDRERAIELERSQSNTDSTTLDLIKSRVFSDDLMSQYSVNRDVQASAIFIPLIQAIERGEANFADNPLTKTIRRCGLFSYPHPFPTAFYSSPANSAVIGGTSGRYLEPPSGTPSHKALTGNELNRYHPSMDKGGFRLATATESMNCYATYAYVLAETTLEMGSLSINSSDDTKAAKSYFLPYSLERVAAEAMVAVLLDESLPGEINESVKNIMAGGCLVPSLAGLNNGDHNWRCGDVTIDPKSGIAERGGISYFGENSYLGISATFSQVDTASLSASLSDADIKQVSQVKESSQGRGTRLTKRQGLASSSSSGTSTSSGSEVGVRPGN